MIKIHFFPRFYTSIYVFIVSENSPNTASKGRLCVMSLNPDFFFPQIVVFHQEWLQLFKNNFFQRLWKDG